MNQDQKQRIGLFVGSFDPFTIGHDEIVRRALPLFDKLVIGVGDNPRKQHAYSIEERVNAIQRLYVKGVRSVQDFEYERVQADYNRKLGGLETLLIYASPEMTSISSTAYRELVHFHKDASWMLPGGKKRK